MKKILKTLKGMTVAAMMVLCGAFTFTGCNMGLNGAASNGTSAERKAVAGLDGWEEFTDSEIKEAQKNCPKKEKAKVEAFEGAAAKLFNLGANLVTEDIENDMLYSFAGYGKQIIGFGMKYLDGMLDSYTGGLYKTAIGVLWPTEAKPDPAITKLQESIDKVSDTVNTILDDVGAMSEEFKESIGAGKITNRMELITDLSGKYFEMDNMIEGYGARELSYPEYYELELNATKHFLSVNDMRSTTGSFYENYYTADSVTKKTFGQAYRLLAEGLYPWRYQSNQFMQQLMMSELAPSTKMFAVCDILMDTSTENVQKALKLDYIKNHVPGKTEVEKEYINAIVTGNTEVQERIEEEMMDIEETAGYLTVFNAAEASWLSFVDKFNAYSLTINNIEIPGEKMKSYCTCNVRKVRYTFSSNLSGHTGLATELMEFCGASDSMKTKETWKKIYRSGLYAPNNKECPSDMLKASQYNELLNFYKDNGLKPTSGKLTWTEGDNGMWYMKKSEGKELDVNLFNIFRYDAAISMSMHENDHKCVSESGNEYPMMLCWDNANDMGFKVYDKDTGDISKFYDGKWYYKVAATYVDSGASSVSQKEDLVLEKMTVRKEHPEVIRDVRYYGSGYVSEKNYFVVGIACNNDSKYNN